MTRLLPLMMLLLSALSALAVIPRRIYHIATPLPLTATIANNPPHGSQA